MEILWWSLLIICLPYVPNLLMDTYFLSFKPCCVDRDAIISGNFKFTSLEDEGTAECWYPMHRRIGMLIHTTSCLHQDAYILPKNHTNLNNASKILSHLFFLLLLLAYWEGLSYLVMFRSNAVDQYGCPSLRDPPLGCSRK